MSAFTVAMTQARNAQAAASFTEAAARVNVPIFVLAIPDSRTMRASIGNAVMDTAEAMNNAACHGAIPSVKTAGLSAMTHPNAPPAMIGATIPDNEIITASRLCCISKPRFKSRPIRNMYSTRPI